MGFPEPIHESEDDQDETGSNDEIQPCRGEHVEGGFSPSLAGQSFVLFGYLHVKGVKNKVEGRENGLAPEASGFLTTFTSCNVQFRDGVQGLFVVVILGEVFLEMPGKVGQVASQGRSIGNRGGPVEQDWWHDQVFPEVEIDVFKDLPHQKPSITLEDQNQGKV